MNVPTAAEGRSAIDAFLDARLAEANVKPRPTIDDWTFLRRVSLDLIGRIPTRNEIALYLADSPSERRTKLVDRLLASHEWADHWTPTGRMCWPRIRTS